MRVLNPAGRRLLELDAEPVGTPYRDALGVAPSLVAVIDECLKNGRPIVRRTVEMSPTLKATHLGVTVSPLAEAADTRGIICLFADLSDVVELEEQLRVKETLARLGELTAGIAHEFRNGLATIHGYSRRLDPQAVPAQVPSLHRGHTTGSGCARSGRHEFSELCAARAALAQPGRP